MWKAHPRSAAGALALLPALAAILLLHRPAQAQPIFSKAGNGTFSNVNTPLLVNDAAGAFQTQGSVLCQAPESGQLSSPSGVCMQYTPSVPAIGGAAAIFGLKGALADYVSPALTTKGDTPPGSSSITVLNNAATSNISQNTTVNGIATLSALSASVSGALPAGETIASSVVGTQTTALRLSSPTLADLPAASTVSFTTNTGAQQFTALAASTDLTAHQGPNSGGQAWAANFITEAEPGSNGLIHGIEIDVADFSAAVGGYGVWLGNNGTQNMNAGLFIGNGVSGKGWLYGVESLSAVTSDLQSASSATNFTADYGTHTLGGTYQGTYATAILQGVNPRASTPSAKALFTITPQGGVVDSSPVAVGLSNGGTQLAFSGSTGLILVCSGTLASFTVALPLNPLPKQTFHVASECNITALTIITQPTGLTVLGAATSITPSTPMTFMFDNDRLTWLRW